MKTRRASQSIANIGLDAMVRKGFVNIDDLEKRNVKALAGFSDIKFLFIFRASQPRV